MAIVGRKQDWIQYSSQLSPLLKLQCLLLALVSDPQRKCPPQPGEECKSMRAGTEGRADLEIAGHEICEITRPVPHNGGSLHPAPRTVAGNFEECTELRREGGG